MNYKDAIVKESLSHSTAGGRNGVRKRSRSASGIARRVLGTMMPLAALLVISGALSGCRLEMYDQPRYEPMQKSAFYADSLSSRPYIQGTVARNQPWMSSKSDFTEATGGRLGQHGRNMQPDDTATAAWAERMTTAEESFDRGGSIPIPVTRRLVLRGKERFNIYCSPCHGRLGDGSGMIVQRGFPRPPSFHIDRLRQAPDGHFYDVITNGFGVMYSYAARVLPEDRWAITAYIRALQLSQNASAQDLPPQERNK